MVMKQLVNVEGDGSCFYRALYGYILLNKNLSLPHKSYRTISTTIADFGCKNDIVTQKVSEIKVTLNENQLFLQNYEQETNWVKCLRYFISEKLVTKENNIIKQYFDSFNIMEADTYNEVIKEFPDWFASALPNFCYNDIGMFTAILKANIISLKSGVSQIEVRIVKDFFNKLGINILIINTANKDIKISDLQKFPDEPADNTIYLLNIDAIHYNFVYYKDGETGMQVGGKKRFTIPKMCINGKLYNCYIDKNNKNKKYIKIEKTKIYV